MAAHLAQVFSSLDNKNAAGLPREPRCVQQTQSTRKEAEWIKALQTLPGHEDRDLPQIVSSTSHNGSEWMWRVQLEPKAWD